MRIAARYLVGNAARVEEEVGWLFEDVMEELRGVYDEEMVKMGDWVLLQSDFDGGAVGSSLFCLVGGAVADVGGWVGRSILRCRWRSSSISSLRPGRRWVNRWCSRLSRGGYSRKSRG